MTEIVFPADGVAKCNGGGLLAGEQEQKILQLIAMNHSMKRACDERDAEIAALRKKYDGRAVLFGQAQADFMLAESAYKDEIAALREKLGNRCEHCGSDRIYSGPPDCPTCGAPNCCENCCARERERAEIARRDELMVRDLAELREQNAEIAALREFVKWHFMHHPQSWPGNTEIMPAIRRALEEKP